MVLTETWRDRALCATFDWTLFQVIELDSPIAYGLTPAQVWSYNQRNHEIARDICMDCPVMVACREAATGQDLDWTVRGGEGPELPSVKTIAKRPPKCKHRKLTPGTKWKDMQQSDLPACEICAGEADRIIRLGVAAEAATT